MRTLSQWQYFSYGYYVLWIGLCTCQYNDYRASSSMCESTSYRGLPIQVQNEHQCLVLEQLYTNFRDDLVRRDLLLNQIITRMVKMDSKLSKNFAKLSSKNDNKKSGFPALKDIAITRDCNELRMTGVEESGVYPIQIPNGAVLNVQCDMLTEGGGWTVIQQREGGGTNFTRNWNDYAFGFGNVNTEYWLGNENLHHVTTTNRYSLRVDLWDWESNHAFAQYRFFQVDSEGKQYQLTVEGFDTNSTAGDSLFYHNGMRFTTVDRDNDEWWGNCAMKDRSGWWFNQCSYCSLNGLYHKGGNQKVSPDGTSTGVTWFEWRKRPGYSLKRVQMKIKPVAAVLFYNKKPKKKAAVFN